MSTLTRRTPGGDFPGFAQDAVEGVERPDCTCPLCHGTGWVETKDGCIPCSRCRPQVAARWSSGCYVPSHAWWSCPSCRDGHDRVRPRDVRPVDEKANDLLADGKVVIVRRDENEVRAVVEGRTGVYEVHVDDLGQWHCTCPAGARRCSHAAAVRKVVRLGRAS